MSEILNNIIDEIIDRLRESKPVPVDAIPHIPLYMDQLTTFMESQLGNLRRYDTDKVMTKTMVNNYAKNKLLPAPEKKKYSEDHMILLLFIYYMKNILSINDISTLLKPLSGRFFQADGEMDLTKIYTEIFHDAEDKKEAIIQDLLAQKESTNQTFLDCPEPDQEFLQIFSYITMLCYDVYVRKQVVEGLVDHLVSLSDASSKEKP